jgi:DNA polymerase
MTAEEKKSVAFFVDLASSRARGGYFQGEREYCFSDDLNADDKPPVMVIGEAPGADEDSSGNSFAGKAGELLDKMLGAINLSRESDCFIINITKCRPPENRESQPDEIAACAGFLESQIRSLKPRFILCLGEFPSQVLLHSAEPIGKLRGKITDYKIAGMTIPLIATYHPGDLLRNEELKRPAWDDLKLLRAALGPAAAGVK